MAQSRRKDLKESRIVKGSLRGLVLWDALLEPGLGYPTVHSRVHRNYQRNQQPPMSAWADLHISKPLHKLPFCLMQALNPSWKLFFGTTQTSEYLFLKCHHPTQLAQNLSGSNTWAGFPTYVTHTGWGWFQPGRILQRTWVCWTWSHSPTVPQSVQRSEWRW